MATTHRSGGCGESDSPGVGSHVATEELASQLAVGFGRFG